MPPQQTVRVAVRCANGAPWFSRSGEDAHAHLLQQHLLSDQAAALTRRSREFIQAFLERGKLDGVGINSSDNREHPEVKFVSTIRNHRITIVLHGPMRRHQSITRSFNTFTAAFTDAEFAALIGQRPAPETPY